MQNVKNNIQAKRAEHFMTVSESTCTTSKKVLEQVAYITVKKDSPTGVFEVQIIEKVTPNTELLRLEREEFWIRKLATKKPFGMNVLD